MISYVEYGKEGLELGYFWLLKIVISWDQSLIVLRQDCIFQGYKGRILRNDSATYPWRSGWEGL